MRISARDKERTRARILEAGRRAFTSQGFEATTTRDLARDAGIAVGTLFNYFPSKEDLAMSLLAEVLEESQEAFRSGRRGDEELAEDLFAHVVAGLRCLAPYRSFVGPVLETALSPFSRASASVAAASVRERHMQTVVGLLAGAQLADAANAVNMHLYWTLYLGVLGFWANDASPHQEDTLVVLDQSMRLFSASLAPTAQP